MKKNLNHLFLSVMCVFCCLMFVSCKSKKSYDEKDFYYFYVKEEDCFAVVRDNQRIKDKLFVPAYYKDKEVRYSCFDAQFLYGSQWWYLSSFAEKTYFPYTHQWGEVDIDSRMVGYAEGELVLNKISEKYAKKTIEYLLNGQLSVENFLLAVPLYELIFFQLQEVQSAGIIKIVEDSEKSVRIAGIIDERTENLPEIVFQKANISYCFNYAGEPNAGYFFVDNYEYGDKIENPPYEPVREGYTFDGWYKEAECNNKWNFDEDRLPQEI